MRKDTKMVMRKFHFERTTDASGVSGTGIVAEGVIFENNHVVVYWFGMHSSINIYSSIEDVIYIHGHMGSTKIVFDDN
jgi:hypothetical protein